LFKTTKGKNGIKGIKGLYGIEGIVDCRKFVKFNAYFLLYNFIT